MRPQKLVLDGFLSYGQKQEIDFSKLLKTGIFIIQGETGSGKSSIIDGIIFALYGRIPRFNKDTRKENFINYNSQKCLVDFEFSIRDIKGQNKTYKITRHVPRNGTTTIDIREKSESEDHFKKLLVDDPQRFISEKIIGLPYESFIRTIVLPQGKFSEFLISTPSQKADIILKIIGIEDIYSFVKEETNKRLREIENIEKIYEQKLNELKDIEKGQNIDEIKRKIIETENEINLKRTQIQKIEKEIEELEIKRIEFENNLSKINRLQSIKEEKEKIRAKIQDKTKEKINLENFINAISLKIEVLEKLYEIANEKSLEEHARELLSVRPENLLREVSDLIKEKREINRKNEILKERSRELIQIRSNIKELSEKIKKLPDIGIVRKVRSDITKLSELMSRKKLINSLKKKEIEKNIEEKDKVLKNLENEIENKQNEIVKLEQEKQKLEEEMKKEEIKKFSIDIRKNLKEGDICPVCGNIFRDKKIHTETESNIEKIKEKYESVRNEIDKKNNELLRITNKRLSILEQKESLERELNQINEKLKEEERKENEIYSIIREYTRGIPELNIIIEKIEEVITFGEDMSEISEILSNIEEQILNCEKEINKLNANEGKISELIKETEKDIEGIQSRILIAKENINTFSNDLKRIESISSNCLKSIKDIKEISKGNDLMQRIVPDLNNLEILATNICETIPKIKLKDENLEETQLYIKSVNELKNKLSESLTDFIRKIEKLINKNKNDLGEKRSELDKISNEIKYYESKVYDIDKEIEKLEPEISEIIKSTENDIKIEIENKLKEITTVKAKKWEDKEKLKEDLLLLNGKKVSLERDLKEIEKKIEEKKDLEKKKMELAEEKKITTIIYGDFSASLGRISFKNYLAAYFIQRILVDYGGKILKEISNGRYSLSTSRDGNIKIIDRYYEGREREPESLSGGEIFISSLSLSLSLALNMMGRAKFECFFIDEGFGLLDQESLEIVINSLEKLAAKGINLGIVSHVEEMKKIDYFSKIKVMKNKNKYSVVELEYESPNKDYREIYESSNKDYIEIQAT